MEKHTVSRLVGSPPGYVGYEEGGQLTEAVRRKPFSVVLFDEIEKAHPDVFNTLLQILEEGRLTDAQGRSVDFRNTVLIMTSNLGTADLRKANLGFAKADEAVTYERMKEKVNDALKQHFRPEFLNRIDETIVFHELSKDEVTQIVDLMIKRVSNQLESQGIGIELTDAAKTLLAERGYDPTLGARPLRRAIQRLVEDPLSERLLYKEFRAGETIVGRRPRTTRSCSGPSRASSRRRWSWPRPGRPSNWPSVLHEPPPRGGSCPRSAHIGLVLLVLTGCHVTATASLRVEASGHGSVRVLVELDRDAARRAGDLRQRLKVDDLRRAGWVVSGPTPMTVAGCRSARPSPSPRRPRRGEVMGEVGAPLADVEVRRRRSFLRTRTTFRAAVDLRRGLESFGDDDLRFRLGGSSFGVPADEAARSLQLLVTARLPGGSVTVWRPPLGRVTVLQRGATWWDVRRIAALAVAAAALVGLVASLRRRRRSHVPVAPSA